MHDIHEQHVLAALHRGQRLEAIQALSACRNIDLEDADILVERYISQHPELNLPISQSMQFLMAFAVLLAMACGVGYFGYFY